ncbi:TOMM precursor leader peptide-binding protein [Corynebacterium timonense]|uniref:Bacteriocin biosynthesis cyclodehydratase domain-containing protein n=1 Tax=Corynebacterium timonense TaxID=441500 RepID=A0A1H1R2A6_9CORY|nr:TOMM precursor leader peptide-binding protein [Corynebacterium timonense]SDS29665.1 bacteriocin biosynthesis cyclodehydratase domain-containing protein [Corynebacterium timonense]
MTENKTYQVNPDLRVSYDGERVVIVAAASTYSLSDGKLWPFIAEVLSTTEELSVPEANGDYSPGDIDRLRSAFDILAQTEILIPCGENVWPDVVVSLANRSGRLVPCEDIAKRLENANILVVDPHHSSSVSRLAAELRHYPIAEPTIVHKVPKNVSADLMVIVAADEHDPVLYEANDLALSSDIRVWTPLTPARGGKFRIGPWFYPNQSACFECLRLRAGSVQREPVLAGIERVGKSVKPRQDRFGSQPAVTSMMISMLTDAIVSHIALDGAQGQAPVGGFAEISYGLEGFELSNHRVLRVPRCRKCSPASGTGYPQIWFHEE